MKKKMAIGSGILATAAVILGIIKKKKTCKN